MCGRYTLTADAQAIQLAFQLDDVSAWAQPRFNIPPSQQVAVITDRAPARSVIWVRATSIAPDSGLRC